MSNTEYRSLNVEYSDIRSHESWRQEASLLRRNRVICNMYVRFSALASAVESKSRCVPCREKKKQLDQYHLTCSQITCYMLFISFLHQVYSNASPFSPPCQLLVVRCSWILSFSQTFGKSIVFNDNRRHRVCIAYTEVMQQKIRENEIPFSFFGSVFKTFFSVVFFCPADFCYRFQTNGMYHIRHVHVYVYDYVLMLNRCRRDVNLDEVQHQHTRSIRSQRTK